MCPDPDRHEPMLYTYICLFLKHFPHSVYSSLLPILYTPPSSMTSDHAHELGLISEKIKYTEKKNVMNQILYYFEV